MGDQKGPANPNWRGGRVTEPRGYVLIRVGTDHPLADVRGYAYEHRLVAQESAGRPLAPGEEVHHVDEIEGHNDPGNLEIKANRHEHAAAHRKAGRWLRNPGEPNPDVACACGCGGVFSRFDANGRGRKYISGHNERNGGRFG